MKGFLAAVSILLLTAGLIACTDDAEEASPAPQPTPLPTSAPPATAVPAPTAAPAPTATRSPVQAAPTAAPPTAAVAPTTSAPPAIVEPSKPTLNEILEMAESAIVQVESSGGRGSGTIFDTLGYVITAEHVVGADASVTITHADGSEERGLVVGRDEIRDLAVVKISGGEHLTALPFGSLEDVTEGDQVVTAGYTDFNDGTTSTFGIVSEIIPHDQEQYAYLQTDATFHRGQSGGPVITDEGYVVGIISRSPATTSPLVTLGWAIGMDNQTKDLIRRMQEGEVNLVPIPPGPGHSYRDPAPLNYPVRVLSRYFDGSPLAHDITVVEVIRGERAWNIIRQAYRFNLPAFPGTEYMLAWVRIDYTRGPEGHTDWVNQLDFGLLSSQGHDYIIPFNVRPPQPFLSARLYPGARIEAWTIWQVAADDPAPLLVFGLDSFYRAGKGYFSTVAAEDEETTDETAASESSDAT
ncbi:MAG: S1C family serine protease [Chloroflexota bacterium]|nr:S1C family serine protease [Chloroflexota bacterium]